MFVICNRKLNLNLIILITNLKINLNIYIYLNLNINLITNLFSLNLLKFAFARLKSLLIQHILTLIFIIITNHRHTHQSTLSYYFFMRYPFF